MLIQIKKIIIRENRFWIKNFELKITPEPEIIYPLLAASGEEINRIRFNGVTDNLIIESDGPEIPILDGSSKIFMEKIDKVGVVNQNKKKKQFERKYFERRIFSENRKIRKT